MLHHDLIPSVSGTARQWMLFTHGIYGMGRNWNAVARKVVASRPGWGAVMVDLREHGASIGHQRPHTIEAAARDVIEMAETLSAPVGAVVGHSFGGKVMLMVARLMGQQAPAEVWVIDSTPTARKRPEGSAWEMLGYLRESSGVFRTRAMAVTELALRGIDEGTAQWMSSNLQRSSDGTYTWRLDLDVMQELLNSFFATDLWDVVENPPGRSVIHFVRASDANTLDDESLMRLRQTVAKSNGRVRLHDVKGGHWLNADNPDAIVDLMAKELSAQ
jgi:pimeloyl-ACP methyl ester carboxylesterase